MTRWGLFLVSIGCIVIILSQMSNSMTIALCLIGVLVVATGFMLIYRNKKAEASVKKPKKKR